MFSGCVTGSASVGMRPPPRAALGRSPPPTATGRGNSVCRAACHVAPRSRRLFLLSSPHKRLFCFPPKIARLASSPLLLWGNSARWPPVGNPHAAPPTPVRPPCWLSPATDDQKAKPNGENDGRGGSCRSHKQADVLDLHQCVGGEAVGSRKHILAVESRV